MICSDNHRTSEFSSMFDEIGGYHLSSFGSRLQLGNSSRINRIRSFSCEQQVEKVTVDSLGYKLYLHVCTYIYIHTYSIQFTFAFIHIHIYITFTLHLHYIQNCTAPYFHNPRIIVHPFWVIPWLPWPSRRSSST